MLVLAFDTAGSNCAVALAQGESADPEILVRKSERLERGHAERLMPMIEAALAQAGKGFAEISRITVTTGPGSFTGVRVGVAAARALGLALAVPVTGVGSLEALALQAAASRSEGTVVALLDAKRGEIYAFARDIASGAVLMHPAAIRPADLAARLESASRPWVLTGSAAPLLRPVCEEPGCSVFGAADAPDIACVVALGARAGTGGKPAPLYLRGADAKPQAGKAVARR